MSYFFVIFLSLYGLVNFYVIKRMFQVIPLAPLPVKIVLIIVFISCAASYILSKTLLSTLNNWVYDWFALIGSYWFAVILYSFLLCLVYDIVRLLRYIIIAAGRGSIRIPLPDGIIMLVFSIVVVIAIITYGNYNLRDIKEKYYSFEISNSKHENETLRVFFFSDAHITSLNNGKMLRKILGLIEKNKPDLVLLGGDILDDKFANLERIGVGTLLQKFKAPLGVYAIPGNHEYISGYKEASNYLQSNGIPILRDSVVAINDLIQIIGRDDQSSTRFWGKKRKTLDELFEGVDKNIPSILLDHQPFNLESVVRFSPAIQLSGHTHSGQMFPFNIVTKWIYELRDGYLRKGNTHFIVSSGVSGWGPPIRTGSDSEVIIIDIKFTK